MIVVALPQVARDLGVDVAATSWIVTSYLIAMASLQPIAGRVGDRLGRRRVMLGALVYFALASAAAAVSTSLVLLAVFRLQQAIAASALVPNGLGLLRERCRAVVAARSSGSSAPRPAWGRRSGHSWAGSSRPSTGAGSSWSTCRCAWRRSRSPGGSFPRDLRTSPPASI